MAKHKQRKDVDAAAEVAHGFICEIHPKQGFGRIETVDGRIIYFHQDSVLDQPFAKLTTGTEVRFAAKHGAHGPQATMVHVVV